MLTRQSHQIERGRSTIHKSTHPPANMLRALSVGDLDVEQHGKASGVNLDAAFNALGRAVVSGWKALRSEETWSILFEATTELYHGAWSCNGEPACDHQTLSNITTPQSPPTPSGDADQFWELDTERLWNAGWEATTSLFQGEYEEYSEHDEGNERS